MELLLSLTFACSWCERPITVTLKCEGAGLSGRFGSPVAAVNLPCPLCEQVNQLLFEPVQGVVRDVRQAVNVAGAPLPSVN